MKLTDLLDQIDRLDNEATKGPWVKDKSQLYDYVEPHPYDLYEAGEDDPPLASDILPHDAEFIALARTALPQLAKALQAVMDCVIDMEQDNGDDSAYSHGVRHMAGTVRHIITDTIGDDDAE